MYQRNISRYLHLACYVKQWVAKANARIKRSVAIAYFHFFWHAQPSPLARTKISAAHRSVPPKTLSPALLPTQRPHLTQQPPAAHIVSHSSVHLVRAAAAAAVPAGARELRPCHPHLTSSPALPASAPSSLSQLPSLSLWPPSSHHDCCPGCRPRCALAGITVLT